MTSTQVHILQTAIAMPPIPVHIDDPITPQRAQQGAPQASTTQEQRTPTHPAAQPGAAVGPAPTPYTPNTRYTPQATRTEALSSNDDPPAPQPGAVPVPPSQQAPMTATSTIPPPPKAGEAAAQRTAPVTTTAPPPPPPPPEMAVPSPQQNYAPTHSTYAVPAPSQSSGPTTTINFGAAPAPAPAPASHPPGYQQNTHAQELNAAARANLDQQERRDSNSIAPALGLGGDSTNEAVGNVWNAVKGWGTKVGETLIETDKKFWETVNKKS